MEITSKDNTLVWYSFWLCVVLYVFTQHVYEPLVLPLFNRFYCFCRRLRGNPVPPYAAIISSLPPEIRNVIRVEVLHTIIDAAFAARMPRGSVEEDPEMGQERHTTNLVTTNSPQQTPPPPSSTRSSSIFGLEDALRHTNSKLRENRKLRSIGT
jgi:hypothetical protein